MADHSLCCTEPRLSASLRSNLAAEQINQELRAPGSAVLISPATECERQTSTLPPSFLSSKTEWKPEKRIAQWMLSTAPQAHTASPHRPRSGVCGCCCSFPTTSYPVVKKVTMFWLSWSGKRIAGPDSSLGLSPAVWASEPALQCTERSRLLTS